LCAWRAAADVGVALPASLALVVLAAPRLQALFTPADGDA